MPHHAAHGLLHPFFAEIFGDVFAPLPREPVPQMFIGVEAHGGVAKFLRRISDQRGLVVVEVHPVGAYCGGDERDSVRQRGKVFGLNPCPEAHRRNGDATIRKDWIEVGDETHAHHSILADA